MCLFTLMSQGGAEECQACCDQAGQHCGDPGGRTGPGAGKTGRHCGASERDPELGGRVHHGHQVQRGAGLDTLTQTDAFLSDAKQKVVGHY